MARDESTGRGHFVTFEGIEGCGKSTQIARLEQRLRGAGVETLLTREPGGTALGRALRRLLLDPAAPTLDADAELLLYAADRAQHLVELVLPALARGELVLCDRFLDATYAYQGHGRGLDRATIRALHSRPPLDLRPDRTLLLDLEPELGLSRARRRDAIEAIDGRPDEGRFEAETLEFHRRVRAGYLELAEAEPDRVSIVDAGGEIETVERRVIDALRDLVPALAASA